VVRRVKEEKLESTGIPELDKQMKEERDARVEARTGVKSVEQRRRDEPTWVGQEVRAHRTATLNLASASKLAVPHH
jgi:hypothetical protein